MSILPKSRQQNSYYSDPEFIKIIESELWIKIINKLQKFLHVINT